MRAATNFFTMLPLQDHRTRLVDAGLLISFVLLAVGIVVLYVGNERAFYFWDFGAFQDQAIQKTAYYRDFPKQSARDILALLQEIRQSTGHNYSDLHSLPVAPILLVFGNSRLTYILAITIIFFAPYALLLAAIATEFIPSHPRGVFFATIFLVALTPAALLPTLRGYPDTGAAVFSCSAIFVYLRDSKLNAWRHIVMIGLLLSLSMLFRRYFVYDAIAFFGSIALYACLAFAIQVARRPRQWRGPARTLLAASIRLLWAGVATLVILAILGSPFIEYVFANDFHRLYASYEDPVTQNFQWYRGAYGWIAFGLAGLGLAAGTLTGMLSRSQAGYLIILGTFTLLQWIVAVRQIAPNYTLQFTTFVILGLVAFGWMAWSKVRGRSRILLVLATGAYLAANNVVAFTSTDLPKNPKSSELFAMKISPLVHPGFDDVAGLVNYLRAEVSPVDSIFVGSSSVLLNPALLRSSESALYDGSAKLKIVTSPQIDSRDAYPLESLLLAQYVLIATPFQFHMSRPEEQKVVHVVVDAFENRWEIARDFTPLPEQLPIAGSFKVRLYRRWRPTSPDTALRTLLAIQAYIPMRPGSQGDWIDLGAASGYSITHGASETYDLEALADRSHEAPNASFLYVDSLPIGATVAGQARWSGSDCVAPLLRLSVFDANSAVMNTATLSPALSGVENFSLPVSSEAAGHLLLEIVTDPASAPAQYCPMSIHELRITPSVTNQSRIEETAFPWYRAQPLTPERPRPDLGLAQVRFTDRGIEATGTGLTKQTLLVIGETRLTTREVSEPDRLLASVPDGLDTPMGAQEVYLSDGARRSNALHLTLARPVIRQLHPPTSLVGVPFNTQQDGTSAFAIETDNATPDTLVLVDGEALSTTFGHDHLVTTLVPKKLIDVAGRHTVLLKNPLGESNPVEFLVTEFTAEPDARLVSPGGSVHDEAAAIPGSGQLVLRELSPASTTARLDFNVQPDGRSALSLDVENAMPGTAVIFDGQPLPTSYGSPSWLTVAVPASVYDRPGHHEVFLRYGSSESNRLEFVVIP